MITMTTERWQRYGGQVVDQVPHVTTLNGKPANEPVRLAEWRRGNWRLPDQVIGHDPIAGYVLVHLGEQTTAAHLNDEHAAEKGCRYIVYMPGEWFKELVTLQDQDELSAFAAAYGMTYTDNGPGTFMVSMQTISFESKPCPR